MSNDLSRYQFLAGSPDFTQGDDKQYRFHGLAYSGKSLRHPYWDNVIFDLSSTRAANARTPILIDHDPAKRAGYAELSFKDNQITITDGIILNNEYGNQVISESQQGFPWQMSVYIDPQRVERLEHGDQASVNGQLITGQAAIFRNAIIREVSFTATGVDYNTHATAMSHTKPESKKMTDEEINALKAQNEALKTSAAESKTALEQASAKAEAAEQALAAHKAETRMSAVKTLFSDMGRDYSEESAKPYLSMDEATFSAIAADMRASKPAIDLQLFNQKAIDGVNPDTQNKNDKTTLNFSAIYAKRGAK